MPKKTVSIIIPVYNEEKFLHRCVDSAINQTCPDLEIILVDDGSTDASAKICDQYAEQDSRIKVIHQKNHGLSAARNAGIKVATGSYLYFLDSDDFLEDRCIELHLDAILRADADISISSHNVIQQAGNISPQYSCGNIIMNSKTALKKMLYDEGVNVSACNKLFAKKLFKNIKFPENRTYEEVATTYKLIDLAQKIVSIKDITYNYVMHSGSITTSKFNPSHMDLIKSTMEMSNYVKAKYPDLAKACDRKMIYSYLSTLVKIVNAGSTDQSAKQVCLNYILSHKSAALKDPDLPKRDRIALISLSGGYPMFCIFWKLYRIISGRKG